MAQNWEGRQWITHGYRDPDTPKLRVLSYHIFADYNKCNTIQYSSTRHWDTRRTKLLQEILSYQPSIVCLQDLDHLNDWWQPMLARNGYDICVSQKTRLRETTNVEFVAVVYKSADFQLFKSIHVELNKCTDAMRDAPSSLKDRCRTDDVGLITFLQPWGGNETMKTALCIASCSIADRPLDEDVRQHQTEYFARQVEIANSEFSLPVIIGMSLHDTPTSPAYHILRAGRVPLQPRAPGKCPKPNIDRICRGSVRVRWMSPPVSNADPPIQYFRISWCPGGSKTLSYKAHIDISAGDCIQCQDVADKKGRIRSVAVEELSYVVSGLSSELAYEFKVTAINKVGVGKSSDSSLPIRLINPPKAPRQPALVNLLNPRQVREMREVEGMELEDWNVLSMVTFDAHNAETKLTPRNLEGGVHMDVTRGRAVLPLHINPRQGWRGGKYLGQGSDSLQEELNAERVLRKSIIRTRDGFSHRVADFPNGKQTDIIDYDEVLGEFHSANNERERIFQLEAAAELEHDNRLLNGIKDSPRSEYSRSNSPVSFAPSAEVEHGVTSGLAAFSVTSTDSRVKALRFNNDPEPEPRPGSLRGGQDVGQQGGGHVGEGSVFSADDDGDGDGGSEGWEDDDDVDDSGGGGGGNSLDEQSAQHASGLMGGSMGSVDLRGASTCSMASGSSYVITENSVEYPVAEEDAVDDVLLDCRDVVYDVGKNAQRQVHALNLRSAYEYYSCAGEPVFTKSEPVEPSLAANTKVTPGVSCVDYIFYSSSYLQMTCLLSMPTLCQLRGEGSDFDPREALIGADEYWAQPPPGLQSAFAMHHVMPSLRGEHWCRQEPMMARLYRQQMAMQTSDQSGSVISSDTGGGMSRISALSGSSGSTTYSKHFIREIKGNMRKMLTPGTYSLKKKGMIGRGGAQAGSLPSGAPLVWGGSWVPYSNENSYSRHYWLPNEAYSSSHIALCAEFTFKCENLLSQWH